MCEPQTGIDSRLVLGGSMTSKCVQTTCGVPRAQQTDSTALHLRRSGSSSCFDAHCTCATSPLLGLSRQPTSHCRREQPKTSRQAGQHPTAFRDPSFDNSIPQSPMQNTARPPETPVTLPATAPPRAPLSFAGSTGKHSITNVSTITC